MSPTVYSPPVETYIALAEIELASATSSVTLTGFSQDYRDLVLVVTGGVTSGIANVRMSLNGDTTNANYGFVHMSGTGSSTNSTAPSGSSVARLINYYGYPEADLKLNIIVNIMDYSATDKHKTSLARSNHADNGVTALATRWANTNAVTSLLIDVDSSTFAIGSTFSLYGIVS
jgi:hypothetical protein